LKKRFYKDTTIGYDEYLMINWLCLWTPWVGPHVWV